jgi:hypothetical protein
MQVKPQTQTNPKTNPQPQKPINKGMEVFLQPTQNSKEAEVSQTVAPKVEPKNKENHDQIEQEIQGKIEEIERQLKIKTTLDLTTFNNIAHSKQLLFKILFIRQKIYLHVKDNNGRSAIIAVNVPRFGGTSLRYMISQCTTEYCKVVEKKTNKGNILSYSPISTPSPNNDVDIEDIFD